MLMLRFKFESFFKRLTKYGRKVNRLEAWRRFLKREHQQEEQRKRIEIEAAQRRWSEQYYVVERKINGIVVERCTYLRSDNSLVYRQGM